MFELKNYHQYQKSLIEMISKKRFLKNHHFLWFQTRQRDKNLEKQCLEYCNFDVEIQHLCEKTLIDDVQFLVWRLLFTYFAFVYRI